MSNTTTEAMTAWSAREVLRLAHEAGITKRSLSEETGIPYPTLNRKLSGKSDLSFRELLLLAQALRVSPATLIPPLFVADEKQVA